MAVSRNVEGLRQSAQRKRQEALDKVERGIRQLLKEGKTINFNTVAEAASVSKAFLYKETEIKARIEQLKQQQGGSKKPELKQRPSDPSLMALNRTLRERIKQLDAEVRSLRRQNETVYSQLVEMKSLRQLTERLQAENDRLKQKPSITNVSQTHLPNTSDFEAEIQSLGIKLNTTINKLIQEAPPEATRQAIESLKEAIAQNRVENRAGFLNKAIRDAWVPNSGYEEKSERDLFNEWFPRAKLAGVVQASTQIEGVLYVITPDDQMIPFEDAFKKYPIDPDG